MGKMDDEFCSRGWGGGSSSSSNWGSGGAANAYI